ncbi:MAG: hypothetical protein JW723_02790 [Bacteroidales bacterium]|nr:hypothetical protein [Bacteroidales bacterium]
MRSFISVMILITIIACKKNEISDICRRSEILVFDSILTTTEEDHGFFFFDPPAFPGSNWMSPCDFYNGEFYLRFEITDLPCDTSFLINFCIWADVIGDWQSWEETCSHHTEIEGNGVFTAHSSPSSWWYKNVPVDFSRADDFERMGIALWCDDYRNLTDWTSEEASCWSERDYLLPLTLRLTIVAVSTHSEFTGWKNYI